MESDDEDNIIVIDTKVKTNHYEGGDRTKE